MSALVDELTCKPLDTLSEIQLFLENLPSWRTLCVELQPHSELLVKNSSLIGDNLDLSDLGPATFCHYNPDTEAAGDEVRLEERQLQKTLVCHDMANGYHDDCKIDGTGSHDAYTFYNWAGIDIFCYFSHHLITIPPLGWINIGHLHGVKVIGTLITEWTEGQEFWDKVLQSESEYKNFASTLVTIAKTLKFDGWLLNVENKIFKPNILLEFVKYLHKILHDELKHPVLIWYDSVTIEGTLNWQNSLNKRNKPFFDACDGIFTNYSWSEEQLRESVETAEDRLTDLFIGIDVWGRNFYGGGQFNTHEAVHVAYSYGCSLAIFAPAWTHEAMAVKKNEPNQIINADKLDQYDQFLLRDRALWDSIWPYLNTRLPSKLPFRTSFCRGQGTKRRLYGEVLCPVPWYNLRHMQYQPNSVHGRHRYIMSVQSKPPEQKRKEKKGIIKYVQASTSKVEMETMSVDEAAEHEKQQSVKRKLKDAFKQIFKPKHKTEDENTHEEEDGIPIKQNKIVLSKPPGLGVEIKPSENLDTIISDGSNKKMKKKLVTRQSSRKSMAWMSVGINLRGTGQAPVRRYELTFVPDERDCLEVYFLDSFIGGSCLKVNPCDKHVPFRLHRTIRLFHCDFSCTDSLIFCVVTKIMFGCEQQTLNIKLSVHNVDGEHNVNLIGRALPTSGNADQASVTAYLYAHSNRSDPEFRKIQNYLLLNEPDFYVPVENSYDWKVRYYKLHMPGSRITSIRCHLGHDYGPILLGYFGVCPMVTISDEKATSTVEKATTTVEQATSTVEK